MAPYTASSAGSPAGSDNRIIQLHMGLQMRALDRDANSPENKREFQTPQQSAERQKRAASVRKPAGRRPRFRSPDPSP